MLHPRRAVLAALLGIGFGHLAGPVAAWAQDPAKPRPEARKVERERNEPGAGTGPVMRQEPRRAGGREGGREAGRTGGQAGGLKEQPGGRAGGQAGGRTGGQAGGRGGAAPAKKPEGQGKPRPELRRRKP